MNKYYDLVYVDRGFKIFKKKVAENVIVRINTLSMNELHVLTDAGKWYLLYSPMWEDENSDIGINIEVERKDLSEEGKIIFSELLCSDEYRGAKRDGTQSLLIQYSNGQLGDLISWTPYVMEFVENNHEKFSTIAINMKLYDFISKLFSKYKPLRVVRNSNNDIDSIMLLGGKIILEDISSSCLYQGNYDICLEVGLTENVDYIHPMGVNVSKQLELSLDLSKRLYLENFYHPIVNDRKYVCIAPAATMKSKMWMHYESERDKWQGIVNFLNDEGYEVWCISEENCSLENVTELHGNKYKIKDRIEQLLGCEFMVGLASGLSWLAHACGKYVFRINAFSYGWTEFQDNVTIIENNNGICRGCFSDGSLPKNEFNHNYCPRNMDFQCSKSISLDMVIDAITAKEGLNGNNVQGKEGF